ncbi:MAG: PrgI family protein [Patescibacteria group bacterium]|nr:PrgI family protein [Patescibacteria group bacterium]MDE1988186.1 PrgI family protein [Patescibacteria group bacterium]MDE2218016.1 PrgI family protein [Patescibacteria group bacterium]
MRFQVPQFIEIEDKIFGPLTLKQFIYLAGGGGISYVIYAIVPYFIVAVFLIIPVALFSLALAFYKVNGKPFIFIVESAVKYALGNKLYLWEKREKRVTKKESGGKEETALLKVPKLSESKLKDLTWSLDIKENLSPITREKRF